MFLNLNIHLHSLNYELLKFSLPLFEKKINTEINYLY